MTTEKWKLEQDLCRCCHAEGTFRSLGMSCEEMGCEEICSDILRDCFNIDLTPLECQSLTTYTICDECINRLGDAFNFKKQVIRCEERFQQMYGGGIIEEVKIGPKTRSQLVKKQPLLFQEVTVKERSSDDEDPRPDDDDHPDGNGRQDGEIEEDCISMEPFEDKVILCIKEDTSMEKIKEQRKRKPAPKKKSTKKTMVKKEKKPVQDSSKQSTNKQVPDKPKTNKKFLLVNTDFKMEGGKYVCSFCDKIFIKRKALNQHVKRVHYKLPRWSCESCDMSFTTLVPYLNHNLRLHNIDKRHKCNACNAVFNKKTNLKAHLESFHMLGETLKCDKCDYETTGKRNYSQHVVMHKPVRDQICRFCDKSFLSRHTLMYHERIHTGDKRKVCRECGKAFVQKVSLNYHMAKCHPEVSS